METYLVGGAVRDELLGLDVTEKDLCHSYKQVRIELKKYSKELEKKKEIVVFNKIDLINKDEIKYKLTKFKKRIKKNVLLISTLDKTSLSEIKSKLIKHVS